MPVTKPGAFEHFENQWKNTHQQKMAVTDLGFYIEDMTDRVVHRATEPAVQGFGVGGAFYVYKVELEDGDYVAFHTCTDPLGVQRTSDPFPFTVRSVSALPAEGSWLTGGEEASELTGVEGITDAMVAISTRWCEHYSRYKYREYPFLMWLDPAHTIENWEGREDVDTMREAIAVRASALRLHGTVEVEDADGNAALKALNPNPLSSFGQPGGLNASWSSSSGNKRWDARPVDERNAETDRAIELLGRLSRLQQGAMVLDSAPASLYEYRYGSSTSPEMIGTSWRGLGLNHRRRSYPVRRSNWHQGTRGFWT